MNAENLCLALLFHRHIKFAELKARSMGAANEITMDLLFHAVPPNPSFFNGVMKG